MQALTDKLTKNPVVYVTRDIERALGLNPDTKGYFIISNSGSFAKEAAKNKENILLISEEKKLNTSELLQNEKTIEFINKIINPSIIVFKNTKQIERICKDMEWPLLNPNAELSNKIEEKISQVKILEDLDDLFLKYELKICKDTQWKDKKFILQFNHSHTGSGTLLIDSEQKLKEIKTKFPNREARISDFIDGPIFTNNNILGKDSLLIGNISYQITGLKPFAEKSFSTIGNDWGFANKYLTKTQTERFELIVKAAGKKLRELGWNGLFGVDAILEKSSGKIYLIEINARQPASTTFESWLQSSSEKDGISIFEAHLASLLGINLSTEKLTPINNGAQVIQRIVDKNIITCPIDNIYTNLKKEGLDVIKYENTDIGTELLRIQTKQSIMTGHNSLNELGNKVINIILSPNKTLSRQALETINSYTELAIGNKKISCPYFNNLRTKARGGLKVFTGKGSTKEILEEISIIEKKERADLSSLDENGIKKFLTEHNIGIDCSGLAYYVLDSELIAKNKKHLKSYISFPHIKNPVRKLLTKLRPAQNINVSTLAQEKNSFQIKLNNIKPGDMIIMIGTGAKKDYNHIMIVEQIDYNSKNCNNDDIQNPKTIHYVHSFAWSADGKYNHGVRRGKIDIVDTNTNLLEQTWTEQNKTGEANETFMRAKQAKMLYLRRLNALI